MSLGNIGAVEEEAGPETRRVFQNIARRLRLIEDNFAEMQRKGIITVRRNSAATDVGTQPRLNMIEGANVTLTVADDPADTEIDITVAVSTAIVDTEFFLDFGTRQVTFS